MLDRTNPPQPELVDLASLVRSVEFQPRLDTDGPTVLEYRDAMREGARFPPIDAVRTPDGAPHLIDGWHRVEAADWAQTGHASDVMLARYVRHGELFLNNAAGSHL